LSINHFCCHFLVLTVQWSRNQMFVKDLEFTRAFHLKFLYLCVLRSLHTNRGCQMARKNVRIFVTGATGQIGSELTLELRRRYGGNRVVAGGHRKPPSDLGGKSHHLSGWPLTASFGIQRGRCSECSSLARAAGATTQTGFGIIPAWSGSITSRGRISGFLPSTTSGWGLRNRPGPPRLPSV